MTDQALASDVAKVLPADHRPVAERWMWIGLVALTIAVYARTIDFGLYLDDYVLARPWTWREVVGAFHGPFDQVDYNDPYFRPLSSVSFAIDWHIWGTNRWGYHLDNLVLHCAATVGVWSVLRRLRVVWWAPLVGAGFFAFVPSNVATVVYVAHRTDAIVAITICLAIGCLHRYAASGSPRWLAAVNLLYVVGLLSKEVAVATVPIVALAWLYMRLERHDPVAAPDGWRGAGRHWRGEMRLVRRSFLDRSAQWTAVVLPLVGVTVVYLAYRTAVMPSGSLGGRFAETQNPVRALTGGFFSTLKGVPWELRALPAVPLLAAFALGFALHPTSRAWRVVLLGLCAIVAGVLPLSFSGGVEPRLLYVAEIGLAIAMAGLATVFAERVQARRSGTALVATATAIVAAGLVAAIAVSGARAQELYEPGGELQTSRDLLVWQHPARVHIPEANLAVLRQNLLDAGLIDADGVPIPDGSAVAASDG